MAGRLLGRRLLCLPACACLVVLTACAPSPDATRAHPGFPAATAASAGRHEAGIDALFEAQARPGHPGAAVGVYHRGKLVFAKGYGLADVEAGTPITPQTRFHVASVSKQFTAFSIALLAREGKVDLDADVRTYLPYVPDFGHRITVRHLILHTSGLRDQWSLFSIGGRSLDDRLRQAQIVSMVARQRGLNFDPGTRHSYCNTGYTLLGEIVHAVSGRTLRQFTTERIFRPLGMDGTFFLDDVTEIVAGRADSYEHEGNDEAKPLKRSLLNLDNVGATGLLTTVVDMAKWAENFTRPKVGDAALIGQVTTNGTLDDGTPIEYGFALVRKRMGGRTVVTHSGSDAGFRALFVYYPDDDFAVMIAANTPFDLNSKVEAIADLYLPKSVAPEAEPELLPPEDPDADPAPLAGVYVQTGAVSAALRLKLEGGKLYRTNWREERENAVLRQDGSFDFGRPGRESFRPVRDAQGRVTALETRERGGDWAASHARIEPSRLDAAGLAPYAGRYRSPELDITYEAKVQDGTLALSSLWMPEPIMLEQVVRDRFESKGWSGVVLFRRDGNGRIRSLTFNGGRASGIVLERVE